jgi:hypothetical protein
MRQFPHAQSAPASSDLNPHKYGLRGVVINSVTGQPIPYSLVQVMSTTPHRATFTDVNGQFEFGGLPGGRQLLEAHKPGFENRDRHGDPLPVELSADTSPVQINLLPLAVITGQVVDERGEPLEGMSIKVSRLKVRNGRESLIPLSNRNTDDEGNFRIPDLMPGKYFVAVDTGLIGPKHFTDSRVGYPPLLYYGGGMDRSGASPVEVKAGEHVDLGFALKPVPTFEISGELVGFSSSYIIALLDRSGERVGFSIRSNGSDTTFTVEGVPAGSYTIRVSGSDSSHTSLTAETTVEVSNDVRGVHLTAQRGVSIPVIVHQDAMPETPLEDKEHAVETFQPNTYKRWTPIPVGIVLQSASSDEETSGLHYGPDGKTLMLSNVRPGTYSVIMTSSSGYVRSATCGGTDLLRSDLVISSSEATPPIEVVIANDTGSLTVKSSPGEPEEPAIIIVSETAPRRPSVPVYLTGNEVTVQLAPGQYKVLVFDALDPDEYNGPDLLNQYGFKATDVTIAPNGHTTIAPNVILAEEE